MSLVILSTSTNPPVSRFSRYGSNAIRSLTSDVADADLVELERGGSYTFPGGDAQLVLQRCNGRTHAVGADSHQVVAATKHRLLRHPDDRRIETIGHSGRLLVMPDDIATADAELVGERDRDGLTRVGNVAVTLTGYDPLDTRSSSRGRHDDLVAGPNAAAGYHAGVSAEVVAGTVNPLHRKAEWSVLHPLLVNVDGLQVFQQRRAVVPAHAMASRQQVVPIQGGDRDTRHACDPDPIREAAVLLLDLQQP